jgi:ABC-2 type transport system ATP-binding protein
MVAPVAAAVAEVGGRLTGVEVGEATLEDVFIDLTGRKLR